MELLRSNNYFGRNHYSHHTEKLYMNYVQIIEQNVLVVYDKR